MTDDATDWRQMAAKLMVASDFDNAIACRQMAAKLVIVKFDSDDATARRHIAERPMIAN